MAQGRIANAYLCVCNREGVEPGTWECDTEIKVFLNYFILSLQYKLRAWFRDRHYCHDADAWACRTRIPSISTSIIIAEASLVSWPPDVVAGLLWCVKDKLGAGVNGALRESVGTNLPSCEIRDLDSGVFANIDTDIGAVKAGGIDTCCQPEAVLLHVSESKSEEYNVSDLH